MAAVSISEFASQLGVPLAVLLRQLGEAGITKNNERDFITESEKSQLLAHLRRLMSPKPSSTGSLKPSHPHLRVSASPQQNRGSRLCRKCGKTLPLDEKNFGHTPNGNFRYVCRWCKGKYDKTWAGCNPGANTERSRDRVCRENSAGGDGITNNEKRKIRALLKDTCAYCGVELNGAGHFDHKTPVAKGGKSVYSNFTLACEGCNLAKHAKTVDEFFARRKECRMPANFHPSVYDK